MFQRETRHWRIHTHTHTHTHTHGVSANKSEASEAFIGSLRPRLALVYVCPITDQHISHTRTHTLL